MKTPAEFVEEWMKTICSNNVEAIVSMYKKEAVLLGTLDGKLRNGHSEIKEYFDFFVKLQPCGKITSIVEEDFGHRRMGVANGTYDFELSENGEKTLTSARFTFVLERAGTKWKIHSHHSSKLP